MVIKMGNNVLKEACVIFVICVTVVSGEQCAYYSNAYYSTSILYKYCSTGCCGNYYDRYCCVYTNDGVIVGAVIGSIVFVAFVVSISVAICCCCRGSRGRGGQILQPATTTTAVIGTGAIGYGQPAYGQGGFGQAGCNQAGYGQVGYPNTEFPGQMTATNVQKGAEQKWEAPPPPYQPYNPM